MEIKKNEPILSTSFNGERDLKKDVSLGTFVCIGFSFLFWKCYGAGDNVQCYHENGS